jgi:hypothetical protein
MVSFTMICSAAASDKAVFFSLKLNTEHFQWPRLSHGKVRYQTLQSYECLSCWSLRTMSPSG